MIPANRKGPKALAAEPVEVQIDGAKSRRPFGCLVPHARQYSRRMRLTLRMQARAVDRCRGRCVAENA